MSGDVRHLASRRLELRNASRATLARGGQVAGIGALAVATGAIAGSGHLLLAGIETAIAAMIGLVCWPSRVEARSSARARTVYLLLFLYVAPLVMFSRLFALVGHNPLYLPDIIIFAALLLMATRVAFRTVAPIPLLCAAVTLLTLHAVYIGASHGYSAAMKGLVLAYYPLAGAIFAAWVYTLDDPDSFIGMLPRYVFPLIPIGLIIVLVSGTAFVPASYGLYLGVAAAFAVIPGVPNRRLLGVATVTGTCLLVVASARRGAALTVGVAPLAAWFAATRHRHGFATGFVAFGALAAAAAIALSVSTGAVTATQVPLIGPLVVRATNGTTNAADNVAIRQAMWSYALRTTYTQNPLLGVGAYHPIDINFMGNDLSIDPANGVHNSFIGYAFYAGFPAAVLVIILFLLALRRTWAVRARTPYAPALFGGLIAVILTALTNVTLETTYMGGPCWLLLGAAIGLAAKHTHAYEARSSANTGAATRAYIQPA